MASLRAISAAATGAVAWEPGPAAGVDDDGVATVDGGDEGFVADDVDDDDCIVEETAVGQRPSTPRPMTTQFHHQQFQHHHDRQNWDAKSR